MFTKGILFVSFDLSNSHLFDLAKFDTYFPWAKLNHFEDYA